MPRIPAYAKKYAMSDLAKCIEKSRVQIGYSQSDLAEKMGVTQQQVSYMENNAGTIKQSAMYELVKILGIDIRSFLNAYGFTNKQIAEFVKQNQ